MSRFFFAWLAFFRIVFDGAFAARLFAAREALPAPAPPSEPSPAKAETKADAKSEASAAKKPSTASDDGARPAETGALQLLALLQREGRLVDFLEQDVTTFSDADVGAAARVVHEGARKALKAHVTIAPLRSEEEGTHVSIERGSPEVKLVGQVGGSAPYRGVLRHKGWRVTEVHLPVPSAGHDAHIVAPAEVEL